MGRFGTIYKVENNFPDSFGKDHGLQWNQVLILFSLPGSHIGRVFWNTLYSRNLDYHKVFTVRLHTTT